jgi:hypothetical protein
MTMRNWKKNQLYPVGLSMALSWNLFAGLGEKWKLPATIEYKLLATEQYNVF